MCFVYSLAEVIRNIRQGRRRLNPKQEVYPIHKIWNDDDDDDDDDDNDEDDDDDDDDYQEWGKKRQVASKGIFFYAAIWDRLNVPRHVRANLCWK